jgi:glycosyltransferase involved in cell wall biosynthesis
MHAGKIIAVSKFIEVMKKISIQVPNVELVIVGDSVEQQVLEKQAAKLSNIKFVVKKQGLCLMILTVTLWLTP